VAPTPAAEVTPGTPPALTPMASPPDPRVEAAVEHLRAAILAMDPELCVTEADALLADPTTAQRVRAWAIFCVAETDQHARAEALADDMRQAHPGDPWTEFAGIAARLGANSEPDLSLLPRSAALLPALADHTDALLLRARVLLGNDRAEDLLALARAHPDFEPLRAAGVAAQLRRSYRDEARLAEATAAARTITGPAAIVTAYNLAGWLYGVRNEEALANIDEAIARSPGSILLYQLRWVILRKLHADDETQRRASVAASVAALLAVRGDTPTALWAAAREYRRIDHMDLADRLEQRLFAEFPDSWAAERLTTERLLATHHAEASRSPAATAEYRTELAAFMARPRWQSAGHREWVARLQFETVRADPRATPEALLAAVEMVLTSRLDEGRTPYSLGVITLVERTPYVERAVQIAREGIAAVEAYIALREQVKLTGEDIAALRADLQSTAFDALGVALTAAGRLDEAHAALLTAKELAPNDPTNLAHFATLAERQGYRDVADMYLRSGLETPDGQAHNACELALAARYRSEHGDLRGFSRHLAALTERQWGIRRAAALATAAPAPIVAPPFTRTRLDGSTLTSTELRGKLVAIKFWRSRSEVAVADMDAFQALADRYAHDPGVVVLSINTHDDPVALRAWMTGEGRHFEVLADGGYAAAAGVGEEPRYWVLDREGRVVFSWRAPSRHLLQQFVWRIESLR